MINLTADTNQISFQVPNSLNGQLRPPEAVQPTQLLQPDLVVATLSMVRVQCPAGAPPPWIQSSSPTMGLGMRPQSSVLLDQTKL